MVYDNALTHVTTLHIPSYISHYSWPPVIPCYQLYYLLLFSMSSYWYIIMQPDYLCFQFLILQHIHFTLFQYQFFLYLPFISSYYFHSCFLHLFYYFNHFFVLTSSFFYCFYYIYSYFPVQSSTKSICFPHFCAWNMFQGEVKP